jgi:hypothetical protein
MPGSERLDTCEGCPPDRPASTRRGYALRLVACFLLLPTLFWSIANAATAQPDNDTRKIEWKVGFWHWHGWAKVYRDEIDREDAPIDLLYVNAGKYQGGKPYTKHKGVDLDLHWPEHLPKADAYLVVLRCEGSSCINENIVQALTRSFKSLKQDVARKGQKIVGLQIDYDCPTKDLNLYGGFLSELRHALDKDVLLSITALLDWFGPGTRISDVIRWTDEFVPQFYDVDYRKLGSADGGIAEPIDTARWAPILNAYRKPYRLGVASYGRLVEIREGSGPSSPAESKEVAIWGEGPLEMAARRKGMFVRYRHSAAGEIILHYKDDPGVRPPVSENGLTKMIVPTQQSVSSAYRAAKAMGGFCSGVVFFRYPVGNEALALSVTEVLRVISDSELTAKATSVEADDGFCATASCSDLFVRLKDRFPAKSLILMVRSSHDLEYFVPDRLVRARLLGPRLIEVAIPAYAGTPRIPVGRAVSNDPVKFTVEEKL